MKTSSDSPLPRDMLELWDVDLLVYDACDEEGMIDD